jgi:hypothetical protein
MANLAQAATQPGRSFRVATYTNGSSASSIVTALRAGLRNIPVGTPDQWNFRSGQVPGEPGAFGLWATYLPEGTDDETVERENP